ncbi:MAG: phospholipid carrier-dependent glycosyltransferase [Candidatus Woesebacteria bacterium]
MLNRKFLRSRFLYICIGIVLVAFLTRVYRLSEPKAFYFDEVYHAFTATTFLHNDPKGYEYWQTPPEGVAYEWTHPPLAKLYMAGGMAIFGENSFGWRISSALFGTGVIAMIGVLAHALYGRKKITLLALLFASLDGLLLSMSRIAMNDMHFLFFALVAVYFYIKFRRIVFLPHTVSASVRNALLTAFFLSLSLASKWTALYVGAGLALDMVFAIITIGKVPLKSLFISMIGALIIIPTVYLASYTQFFMQGHTLTQWKETTQQMWWYHTGLKATHPYQSRPLQWITDTRPVWMSVDYSQNAVGVISNIYNAGNPILFWIGLATMLFVAIICTKKGVEQFGAFITEQKIRKKMTITWSVWFPLFLYGVMWIPWQFSPRIMFFYHYSPAVPFLCILTAYIFVYALDRYRRARPFLYTGIVGMIIAFVVLFPLNTGYPMPQKYFDTVFSVFPSWK